jgi:hypothetical protein
VAMTIAILRHRLRGWAYGYRAPGSTLRGLESLPLYLES